MNLSHTHAHRPPQPQRYVGVGLVVALHIAAIYAFSAGLIHPPVRVKEPTVLLPPIPDKPREPETLRKPVTPDKPSFSTIQVPEIPAQPWQVEQPTTVTTTALRDDAPPLTGGSTAGTVTPAHNPPAEQPLMRTPGAVCAVMPKPDVPAVNWAGEAVFNVIATVRGGKVVGTEIRVTQGALDSKTRRSFQRSVEAALAGYQCQGDAMFQQDFAFRLD